MTTILAFLTKRRYRCLLWILVLICVTVLIPPSFQDDILGIGIGINIGTGWDNNQSSSFAVAEAALFPAPWSNVTTTTTAIQPNDKNYSPSPLSYASSVMVDTSPPYYRALLNRYLIGPYLKSRIPEHTMDVVIMASRPDATLAVCIHNLFHLCGFRRFIVVVNDRQEDCPTVLDLMPQHNPKHPHLCLDHYAFYTTKEIQRIASEYPALHRGAPGKLQRGNRKVQIPRMGWYLQQCSKLLISQWIPDLSTQYLAIDGDLVFTRPFAFQRNDTDTTTNTTFVMPTTSKSPIHWKYFVDYIFGNQTTWATGKEKDTTTTNRNYVVGWMVLDQIIVHDLITDMNRLIEDDDTFPFNILNQGEKMIHQTFFSEFYVYARYAQHHSRQYLYQYQPIPEPARNTGNFQYTCILTKNTYGKAQHDLKLAPFLIWEEHKHHAFDSCPDIMSSSKDMTQLSTIGIWHDFHLPPWGGGNQFLLALRRGFQTFHNLTVLVKSDENDDNDGAQWLNNNLTQRTTQQADHTAFSSQALLANSVTFKGNMNRLEQLKTKHQLALVHRVDGPYYSTRYGRPLPQLQQLPHHQHHHYYNHTTNVNLPFEDSKTQQINRQYACATIFQSKWSLDANRKIGLQLRNPILISNTVDDTIFYPNTTSNGKLPIENGTNHNNNKQERIRIVATSHSNNARKGFDTMLWIDEHLDFETYDVVYMGGIPKQGFVPKHITIIDQVDSMGVADFLRTGHIYLAPSREEPASNAVLEALACGLPVVYQKGSSHGELVGQAGRGFTRSGPELIQALEEIVRDYDQFVQAIYVPTMEQVSRQYLAIMRWCFYMKHLYFQS